MPILTIITTMVIGGAMIAGISAALGIHPLYVMAASVACFGAIVAFELLGKHYK